MVKGTGGGRGSPGPKSPVGDARSRYTTTVPAAKSPRRRASRRISMDTIAKPYMSGSMSTVRIKLRIKQPAGVRGKPLAIIT